MMVKPFVSIVVPNLNNRQRLETCLDALMKQTYPKARFEVIVVDNGSTDGSVELIQKYPVQFYQYLTSKNPYPCRNLGIQKAKGNIIGLLDSNCIPEPYWLEGGAQAIRENKGDIIIGPLEWGFSAQPSVFEKFDYLLSVIKEEDLAEKVALPGGNLFVQKILFENLGLFSTDTRSLADIDWTGKAYEQGYKFGFADKAKVHYPAKSYHDFVKKAIRLGKGRTVLINNDSSVNKVEKNWILIKLFLPPMPRFVRWLASRSRREQTGISWVQLFFLAWFYKALRGIGMLKA